jgi:GNAT superfamily N-acetyltransferase
MIRPARVEDVPTILRFIHELAAFERLADRLETSEAALRDHLFGPRPCCEAWLAWQDGQPVGFALCFVCYSTFKTSPCLWLEDLYVTPAARARGHGGELLRHLAQVAVARGYPRLDWAVLDWNAGALGFYRRLGARVLDDWRICRLEGDALAALGSA